ncbi:hypothetical protein [Curvivirga sp.]|uniref:hypothetical protein n=1 Tax=Curvivirga sp. TaxID=2856848 RepID=UPI003B5BEDB6
MTSNLKIALLTSDMPFLKAFAKALQAHYPNIQIFEEKREISASFETRHEVDGFRDEYEIDIYFDGKEPSLKDIAPTHTYRDVNSAECVKAIKDFEPDALIAFGTGVIREELLGIKPDRFVTLHGADPEQYRGLDTHLWAIYHGDFDGLMASLLRAHAIPDQGGVVMKMPIPIKPGMKFFELRKAYCDICIDMVLSALNMLESFDQFISQPQRYIGRHYSFMPAVLKDRCIQKFYSHVLTLED